MERQFTVWAMQFFGSPKFIFPPKDFSSFLKWSVGYLGNEILENSGALLVIKQAEILLNFLKSYLIYHFEIWRQLALKIQSRFFLNKFCFDNCTKAMIDGSLLYFGFLF